MTRGSVLIHYAKEMRMRGETVPYRVYTAICGRDDVLRTGSRAVIDSIHCKACNAVLARAMERFAVAMNFKREV